MSLDKFDDDLSLPLVLDLDGTLIAVDSLHEAFFLFLKRNGRAAWRAPFWTLKGRAVVKERLATEVTDSDVEAFPVNAELLAFSQREAERGREIVLATAADRSIAEKVTKRFPFIARVVASDGRRNLRGAAKAEVLSELYPHGFIYAGDSASDIHVWHRAKGAIVASSSPRLLERAKKATAVLGTFPRRALGFSGLRRALRLHQWAKNALVFVPLALGGKLLEPAAWIAATQAFFAMSLLASATYLLNDLWDLSEDRQHWSKRHRPLASGQLSISLGVGLIALFGLGAFGLALAGGVGCTAMLLLYLSLSLAYSFRLKREPIIDVFALAALFTTRLALGAVVVDVAFSPWLFVFSMFIFLSLSLAKRQTEIVRMVERGKESAAGRGYRASDAPMVLAMGVASMVATVLIMVIYLIEDAFPKGIYHHPFFLWGFAPILFLWLSRIWLKCHRGELNDDPVAYALKDKASLGYAAAMACVFVAALL